MAHDLPILPPITHTEYVTVLSTGRQECENFNKTLPEIHLTRFKYRLLGSGFVRKPRHLPRRLLLHASNAAANTTNQHLAISSASNTSLILWCQNGPVRDFRRMRRTSVGKAVLLTFCTQIIRIPSQGLKYLSDEPLCQQSQHKEGVSIMHVHLDKTSPILSNPRTIYSNSIHLPKISRNTFSVQDNLSLSLCLSKVRLGLKNRLKAPRNLLRLLPSEPFEAILRREPLRPRGGKIAHAP